MRLVLDTNVVVSALIWGGLPYKLIEAAVAGDIELVTSPALLTKCTSCPKATWTSGAFMWR